MDFKTSYPDYIAIEKHIRHAHLERSFYLAHALADILDATIRGIKRLAGGISTLRPTLTPPLKDPATR